MITKDNLVKLREEVDQAYSRFAAMQMGNASVLTVEQKVDAEIGLLKARNAWQAKQEEYAAMLQRYIEQEQTVSASGSNELPAFEGRQ